MKSPQEQCHVVCIIISRTLLYHVSRYPLVDTLLLPFHDRDTEVEKRLHSWQKRAENLKEGLFAWKSLFLSENILTAILTSNLMLLQQDD